jgi:hypothetical protein
MFAKLNGKMSGFTTKTMKEEEEIGSGLSKNGFLDIH